MKTIVRSNLFRMCLVVALLTVSAVALAQPDATTFLTNTHGQLKGISQILINVISVGLGIVGAVMLIPNGIKYMKGDPSSSDSLMKLGAGLVIAAIILQVLKVTFLAS